MNKQQAVVIFNIVNTVIQRSAERLGRFSTGQFPHTLGRHRLITAAQERKRNLFMFDFYSCFVLFSPHSAPLTHDNPGQFVNW